MTIGIAKVMRAYKFYLGMKAHESFGFYDCDCL